MGDRVVKWPGQNPASTLENLADRMTRRSLGTWLRDALGSSASGGIFTNLECVPGTGMYVKTQPVNASGLAALYQIGEEDATQIPTGSSENLPVDPTLVVLQGLQSAASGQIGPMTAPGSGLQVYYLLEAQVVSTDADPASVLFVSSAGSRTFSTVNTTRRDLIVYQLKAGTPSASPTIPSTDSGWVAVATILVPHGVTQITTGMITTLPVFTGFLQTAGTLGSRQSVTVTTSTLAGGATANILAPLSKSFLLLSVATTAQARVELYKNAAERAADASRPIGTPADPGIGLIFEGVTTPSALTIDCSPQPVGSNTESTPSANIPVAITNTYANPASIGVTFVFLALE